MRAVVAVVLVLSITRTIVSQGLVNFYNDASTPVYAQELVPGGAISIMNGPRGSYYFGLLIGPPNNPFFSGIYGTNTGVSGLFSGGTVAVPGWLSGTATNFFIAGWSADMGHDFSYSFLGGANGGDFGYVQGEGVAGNGSNIPALNPWGSLTSLGFLTLSNTLVPEPSATSLFGVAAAVSLLIRRETKSKR